MSQDWVKDIHDMQTKYKTREWVENADKEKLKMELQLIKSL